jgi:hypothetical protein
MPVRRKQGSVAHDLPSYVPAGQRSRRHELLRRRPMWPALRLLPSGSPARVPESLFFVLDILSLTLNIH